jgi:hypothetical protein
MTSLDANDEENIQIDPAEPLKGIVVCCTSIPAEHRVSTIKPVSLLMGPSTNP